MQLTALTTDISQYVSWLMPDIFTSWLFLGGLLFFISTQFTDKLFSAVTIIVSFIAHNSHPFLLYSSAILLLLLSWRLRSNNYLFWRTSRQLSLLVVILTLGLCALNFILNNNFALTNNNSVYYINKLAYHGVLAKTLDKYCFEKKWKLCNYKEVIRLKGNKRFPNWYFWGKDSPLHKMGGWENNSENRDEYEDIIVNSLKSFLPMILRSSLKESSKQLTISGSSSRLHKYDDRFGVFRILQRHYSSEFDQFMNGKQQVGQNVKGRMFPLNERITQMLFVAAGHVPEFL